MAGKGGHMDVEVNWLGIILATAASMVVGYIWYARPVLGSTWLKIVKLDEKRMKEQMPRTMIVAVLTSFVTAYVLAHVTFLSYVFFNESYLSSALTTAFWLWLGLVAARFLVHDAFEQRPVKLTYLNIGNELATLLAMALVIGIVGL